MMKRNIKLLSALIVIVVMILAAYIINGQKQGREEIAKITDDYISGLLPQVREAGVTEINILSRDIKVRIFRATAKLDIVFNVYNPETKQMREDKDTVTFFFKKSKGQWEISDVKYDKTRW